MSAPATSAAAAAAVDEVKTDAATAPPRDPVISNEIGFFCKVCDRCRCETAAHFHMDAPKLWDLCPRCSVRFGMAIPEAQPGRAYSGVCRLCSPDQYDRNVCEECAGRTDVTGFTFVPAVRLTSEIVLHWDSGYGISKVCPVPGCGVEILASHPYGNCEAVCCKGHIWHYHWDRDVLCALSDPEDQRHVSDEYRSKELSWPCSKYC